MAATVTELRKPRSGVFDQLWHRTYTRTFRVLYDGTDVDDSAKFVGPVTVALDFAAASAITQGTHYKVYGYAGAVVEEDTGAFANRINIECETDDGFSWLVTVEYGIYDPNIQPKNPIDWPIKITWSSETYEEPVERDVNDDAVLNSAEDAFDPPLTRDRSRPILRIVTNEPTFDPAYADSFSNTLNNAAFFGQPAGRWLCKPIQAELEYNADAGTPDGYYYTVTYEFHYNPKGWKAYVLDQGLRVITAGVKVAATEAGIPVTSPVPLDGSGAALATGGTPFFRDFDIYPDADFSLLNLDPTGAPGQP